jgi:hypothetical protein
VTRVAGTVPEGWESAAPEDAGKRQGMSVLLSPTRPANAVPGVSGKIRLPDDSA